jgi:long-chain acyl-CoA synthetase
MRTDVLTLVEMLQRSADLFPDKTAVIHNGSKIPFRILYERSTALMQFLVSHGFRKGDRVGLMVHKSPEAIMSFLGVAQAGGVIVPIDHNQTIEHLGYMLDTTKPVALIVSSRTTPVIEGLKYCSTEPVMIISISGVAHNWFTPWTHYHAKDDVYPVSIEPNDVVYLNFTSGTTGEPKGAITTHENIYWNTRSCVETLRFTHEDVHLCNFPIFCHPHELFSRALYLGGTIVLADDVLPQTIARAISEHKVTCMMGIAMIYANLVHFAVPPDHLSTLRVAESGGATVDPTLIESFKRLYNISIIPVWGSTESAGVALAGPISGELPETSMGTPCQYYQVKVINERGEEAGVNEIGEMIVKGEAVCSGYYNNPQETAKHMRNGWLYTGDIVKRDINEFYYFVSRNEGMMKIAGLRVYPAEIEKVILSHECILEVAVVKMRDHIFGEVPRAVVVLKKNAKISELDLKRFCASRMEKHKLPAVVEFRTELPKTPAGKILYQRL